MHTLYGKLTKRWIVIYPQQHQQLLKEFLIADSACFSSSASFCSTKETCIFWVYLYVFYFIIIFLKQIPFFSSLAPGIVPTSHNPHDPAFHQIFNFHFHKSLVRISWSNCRLSYTELWACCLSCVEVSTNVRFLKPTLFHIIMLWSIDIFKELSTAVKLFSISYGLSFCLHQAWSICQRAFLHAKIDPGFVLNWPESISAGQNASAHHHFLRLSCLWESNICVICRGLYRNYCLYLCHQNLQKIVFVFISFGIILTSKLFADDVMAEIL